MWLIADKIFLQPLAREPRSKIDRTYFPNEPYVPVVHRVVSQGKAVFWSEDVFSVLAGDEKTEDGSKYSIVSFRNREITGYHIAGTPEDIFAQIQANADGK